MAGKAGAITNNNQWHASLGRDVALRGYFKQEFDGYEGIHQAINDEVEVINLSWYTSASNPPASLADAVERALVAGIVVVAASGNGTNEITPPEVKYPAAYVFGSKQVIAVAATDQNDEYLDTCPNNQPDYCPYNYSPGTNPVSNPTDAFIDVAAPGVRVYVLFSSSNTTHSHVINTGTSFAAPIVSALAALILSVNEALTVEQVYDIITSTTVKADASQYPYTLQANGKTWNQRLGYGRIDAYEALKYTLENYGGTLTQDVIVPAGDTWNLGNVTLKFASGKGLKVYGTLNANGATFTANGSSWSGLYFASGSDGTLDNVTVDKVHSYGGAAVYINSASPTIRYSTIKNCSGTCSGIYVSNGNPFLFHNTIQGNAKHGVSLYNGSANLIKNNITANTSTGNAAVRCDYYATPLFGYASSPYFEGRNTMTGAYYGVYAEDNASPDVGVSSSLAYNNRFVSNTKDAYTTSGADIVAKYAWWGEPPPASSQIVGDVTYTPYRTSDPGAAFKAGSESPTVVAAPGDLRDLLVQAIERRYQGDHDGAINLLQQILAQTSDSREAQRALIELGHLERIRRDGTLLGLIASHVQPGSPLRVVAMEVLLGFYAEAGAVAAAEDLIEILLRDYARTSHALNARLMRFYLCLDRGDRVSAQRVLADLETADPADEAAQAARWLLYLEGVGPEPRALEAGRLVGEASGVGATDVGHAVLTVASYPNPFNPVATIRYALPSDGHVALRVYNLLGREVATLVDRQQQAGIHRVTFDATLLASGTYLYRLEAAEQVKTGRLVLLK